jgi:hypothetical protein
MAPFERFDNTSGSTPSVEPPGAMDREVYPFLRGTLSSSQARVELKLLGQPETLTLKQLYRCKELMRILRETVLLETISTKGRERLLGLYQRKLTLVKRLIEEREAALHADSSVKDPPTKGQQTEPAADATLAAHLTAAIRQAKAACTASLALNETTHADGTRRYTLDLTSDPAAGALTRKLVHLPSMQVAKVVQQAIHGVLDEHHIHDATNREHFPLSDSQLAALTTVMTQLVEPAD